MTSVPNTTAAPFISVIIPAWNEAAGIAATIRSVHCLFIKHEIIVVDAGSADETARIAENAGARVIESPRRQRAAQMNLGAANARGGVFLFLHADTRLGPGSLLAIREALRDPRVVGGAFARHYDSPSRVLAVTCWLANLRNRFFGWHLGDQAIFARCYVFQRCGPFADADLFEDLDLSRKLACCGRLVTLRPPVISAARRFAKDGPWLRTVKDLFLTCRYLACGLAPAAAPEAVRGAPALLPSVPPRPIPARL